MPFVEVATLLYVDVAVGYEESSQAIINTDKIIDCQPAYNKQAWIIDCGGGDYRYVVSNETWAQISALIGVVKTITRKSAEKPIVDLDDSWHIRMKVLLRNHREKFFAYDDSYNRQDEIALQRAYQDIVDHSRRASGESQS